MRYDYSGEETGKLQSHHSYAGHTQTSSRFNSVTSDKSFHPAISEIEQITGNNSLSRYVFSFDFVIGAGDTTDIDAIYEVERDWHILGQALLTWAAY